MKKLLILLTLICSTALFAVEAPDKIEWQPVQAAIDSNSSDAETKIREIVRVYPKWVDGFIALSSFYLRNDMPEKALVQAQIAKGLDSKNTKAMGLLLLINLKRERYKSALEDFDSKFRANDDDGTLHHYASLNALALSDLTKAKRTIDKAIEIAGRNAPAAMFAQKGLIEFRMLDYKNALSSFNKATDREKQSSQIYYNKGITALYIAKETSYTEEKDKYLKAAKEALMKASSLDKNNSEIKYTLGVTLLDLNNPEQAINSFEIANKINPKNKKVSLALAAAYVQNAQNRYIGDETKKELYNKANKLFSNLKDSDLKTNDINNFFAANIGIKNTNKVEQLLANNPSLSNKNKAIGYALLSEYFYDIKKEKSNEFGNKSIALLEELTKINNESSSELLNTLGKAYERQASFIEDKKSNEYKIIMEKAANSFLTSAERAKEEEYGDFSSRDNYLAIQTKRSPKLGYEAGIKYLSWKFNKKAVYAIVGNYGASKAWKKTPHLIAWAIVIIIALLFALKKAKKHTAEPVGYTRSRTKGDQTLLPGEQNEAMNKPLAKRQSSRQQPRKASPSQMIEDETLLPNTAPPKNRPLENNQEKRRKFNG